MFLKSIILKIIATDNEYLGVYTSHAYTKGGFVYEGLKGSDKALADLFINANVPVSYVAVLGKSKTKFQKRKKDKDSSVDIISRDVFLLNGDLAHAHSNHSQLIPFTNAYETDASFFKDEYIGEIQFELNLNPI